MVGKNSDLNTHTNELQPKLLQGKILKKISISGNIEKIRVENDYIARIAQPGQFVNVKTTRSYRAFLRRPFSINCTNANEGWFEILYRILGNGTRSLNEQNVGDTLDFIGPLGNSFPESKSSEISILVAGGLGIAPLEFLAQKLVEKGKKAVLFWGNPGSEPFAYANFLKELNIEMHFASDDGSIGFHGNVIEHLEAYFADKELTNYQIYSCGPDAMLVSLAAFARKHRAECYVSLETMMACGFGACMGCNVSRSDGTGYFYVCKDGPVFNIEDIRIHG